MSVEQLPVFLRATDNAKEKCPRKQHRKKKKAGRPSLVAVKKKKKQVGKSLVF